MDKAQEDQIVEEAIAMFGSAGQEQAPMSDDELTAAIDALTEGTFADAASQETPQEEIPSTPQEDPLNSTIRLLSVADSFLTEESPEGSADPVPEITARIGKLMEEAAGMPLKDPTGQSIGQEVDALTRPQTPELTLEAPKEPPAPRQDHIFEFGNIQVALLHSPTILKAAVATLLVFSMAALIALACVHHGIKSRTEDMQAEAADLDARNQTLETRIQDMDSPQVIEQIAQEELGLVQPDTILIQPH